MPVSKINSFDLNAISKATSFVLDTNILYFVHSGYYTKSFAKRNAYSDLLQQIVVNGNPLLITALNLQEFIFGIENKEYELYLSTNGKSRYTFTKKDFRKVLDLRLNVQSKIKTVLAEINSIYRFRDSAIEVGAISQFVDDYAIYLYDPMDYLVVHDTRSCDIIYITDDTDFYSDSRINVLTI